jgi:hypothetical protein
MCSLVVVDRRFEAKSVNVGQTAVCHTTEDIGLHSNRCEDLKTGVFALLFFIIFFSSFE